jgi:pyruvate ferredoxin oxidoreductase delta subunit
MSVPLKGAMGRTGDWRTHRPVKDAARCTSCGLCATYCPEGCIERPAIAIDYEYCKGCGVCAEECPRKAIAMVEEEL